MPIGVDADGQPVELDLKESAQDGMGPHGLVIGATGSGKSELLRTLVLGLAATHSSETLNFVLIDYKGGATFASLDRLPHVAAVITNLADELTLVDRMSDAINGEVLRRQELLRRAGNFASIHDYERARPAGARLAPLPTLLIVCDEFSELLTAKPDFIDLFVQIGRVGRSLGVHLLLASPAAGGGPAARAGHAPVVPHRPAHVLGAGVAGRARRARRVRAAPLARATGTSSTAPSRWCGSGRRTRPARTSRRPRPGRRRRPGRPAPGARLHAPTTSPMPVLPAPPPPPAAAGRRPPRSLLDVLVGRLAGQGPPAHQVWLPPLVAAAGARRAARPGAAPTRPAASPPPTPTCTARCRFRSR